MGAHARLAPSSGHRWMNCPGSVELCKDVEDQHTEAARVGTGAHSLCERTLRAKQLEVSDMLVNTKLEFKYDNKTTSLEINGEMIEHCNVFVRRIIEHLRRYHALFGPAKVKLYLEKQIDLSHVRKQMFGTSDVVIDVAGEQLVISDFKYGFVPVHLVEFPDALPPISVYHRKMSLAEKADFDQAMLHAGVNEQLLIYAAGAAYEYAWLHESVVLEIVQPRCMEVSPVQSIVIPTEWLREWSETTLWTAACATEISNAPLIPGNYCRFCPANFKCPALRDKAQELAQIDFAEAAQQSLNVEGLQDFQLADILRWAPIFESWIKEVSRYAFERLLRKEPFPGYKLVRGRNSRSFPFSTYEEGLTAFAETLNLSGSDELKGLVRDLAEPIVLKSPAQIEKLGKVYKEAVKQLQKIRPGALTLANETDKRPAAEPLVTDFEAEPEPVNLEDVMSMPEDNGGNYL